MLRPTTLLPPLRGLATPRSDDRISPAAWGLLPGSPAITRAGLPPAGSIQHARACSRACARSLAFTSGRTMARILRARRAGPMTGAGSAARALLDRGTDLADRALDLVVGELGRGLGIELPEADRRRDRQRAARDRATMPRRRDARRARQTARARAARPRLATTPRRSCGGARVACHATLRSVVRQPRGPRLRGVRRTLTSMRARAM